MASSARRSSCESIASTSIRVLRTFESLRSWRRPLHIQDCAVGLVPTMGALHHGHLSLIRAAAKETEHVVVSIYVNPSQFGVNEDLASYPRTWESDCRVLAELDRQLARDGTSKGRISAIFAPTTSVMYPSETSGASGGPGQKVDSDGSFVTLTPIGRLLEGASRPTFFRGVATVCMKLFNAIQPHKTYFGQKDVQQTVVIKKMVKDFLLPVEVAICPTEREPDGLAMSSRNAYLGERRRKVATVLHGALQAAARQYIEEGVTDRKTILDAAQAFAQETLDRQMALPAEKRARFEIDYISLADPDSMEEVVYTVDPAKGAILSGAVAMLPVEKVGTPDEDLGLQGGPWVRLIDNIILPPAHARKNSSP